MAYERMLAAAAKEISPDEKNTDFLKIMRAKIIRKQTLVVFLTFCILAGLTYYAFHYYIPVPYNSEYMSVELYQAALIKNEGAAPDWTNENSLDYEESNAVLDGKIPTKEMAALLLNGPVPFDEIDAYSRDINRNGENVKITYYCYTESLWRKLFYHNTNTEFHIWSSGDMYDFCQAEYMPQKREIYYLAVGNLSGLEHISDEEFDALKENAILVWSGIN